MNEITLNNNVNELIGVDSNLFESDGLPSYYSIKGETVEEKKAIYNALNNPENAISDQINGKIKIKDLLVEMVKLQKTDDKNNPIEGEYDIVPRIVIIDDFGVSHHCVSMGVYNSIKKIIQLFGQPTYDEPIEVEIKQVKVKNGSMLTLNLV